MLLCPFCSRSLGDKDNSCCCGAINVSAAVVVGEHKEVTVPVVGRKGRYKVVKILKEKPVGAMVKVWIEKPWLKKVWKQIREVGDC